jgi:putative phosphonate metabolism protein
MQPGPVHGQGRFALYWAPELDDPLHAAGSAWLGRDAETGAPLRQPVLPDGLDIAEVTADARSYGLHATLKAPFRLACSYAELEAAVEALAARTAPFDLPPLAVRDLGGFLALRETAPCPALHALADASVAALDPCRAPLTEVEWARRRRGGLSAEQEARIARWGYHYVFEAWLFHVTLSRRLTPAERAVVLPAVTAHLAEAAARPRRVASLCLFSQAAPGAPFLIARRVPLRGPA